MRLSKLMLCIKVRLTNAASCCGLQKAVMQVNDAFFEGHVVVIGTLLAGIGPTCRGYPYCREE